MNERKTWKEHMDSKLRNPRCLLSECSYANPTPTAPWGKGAPAFVYTFKQGNGSAMAGVKTRL